MDKEKQSDRQDFGSKDFDYPEDMFLLDTLKSYPGDLPPFEPEVYTEPEQGQAIVFDAVKRRSLQPPIPVANLNKLSKSRKKSKTPYFIIAAFLLIITVSAVFWDDIKTSGSDESSNLRENKQKSSQQASANEELTAPSFQSPEPPVERFEGNDAATASLNKNVDNNETDTEQKNQMIVPDIKGQKLSPNAAISDKSSKTLDKAKNATVQKQENVTFNPEEVKIPEKKNMPPQEQIVNLSENLKYKESRQTQTKIEEQATNYDVFTSQPKPNSNSVYTVQVYSTPFREDAEEWAGKLNKKDASDVFISEQKVRDKVWYRVRFGNFKTKEEARAAALKLGFAQSWVDRVR